MKAPLRRSALVTMALAAPLLATLPALAAAASDLPAAATPAVPDPTVAATPTPTPVAPSVRSGDTGVRAYFDDWFTRANAAQAAQPHWMTPLVTVTPRLEQEFRYDQYWEHLINGGSLDNYDTGKGLELIPTLTNEVILGAPPYLDRGLRKPASGFGDWPFFLVKQRLLSANEQDGNYIVTAFLAGQAPIGIKAFTADAYYITPTLAAGKGWGDFDVQATIGTAVPTDHIDTLGVQLATNVTLQYHLLQYLWPEFEVNDTLWLNGHQRGGLNQVFLTPGIIFGRFEISGRVKLAFGVGYQFAVSPTNRTEPVLTPLYDHNWIFSARLTF